MKKIVLWTIRLCSIAILLVPLIVDDGTIFPYTFSKIIAFQLLVELSLGAYIILQFLDPSYRVQWRNRLIQAQAVWIGVLCVLSFVGVDAVRSWWSSAQWMTGTTVYLHFFAWFIILASVFRSWKDWRTMIGTSVIASCIIALFGLGQLMGIGTAHYDSSQGRIFSTLGNPIYLAQYLLLHIFLTVFLLIKERALAVRIPLGLIACVLAATVFFTGTRSAVLVLLISLGLFLVTLLFSTKSKKYRILSFFSLVAVALTVVGLFLWLQTGDGTQWAKAHMSPGMQRIVYQTFQDPARVELSRIAFQGFTARPLFGWGPNNYSYVFSTYVRPQDYGTVLTSRWYDQAHNQVMNILATTGVVGFLAFLLPWCAAWWLLWKRFITASSNHERVGFSIVGLFFFAYFLQNLTIFDTPGPLITLYFVFAFVVFLTTTHSEKKEIMNGARAPLACVVPVVCVLTLILAVTFSIAPYVSARTGRSAIDTVAKDFDRGFTLFKRALSGPSAYVNDDVRTELAQVAFLCDAKKSFPKEKKKECIGYVLEQLEESAKNHPYSLEYDTLLLQLYRSYARYSPSAVKSAEELAEKLIERYPNRRDVLFDYVFIELAMRKGDRAAEYAQKIIDLDPTRADAHWWMAQVLAVTGDVSRALDEIDQARNRGYPIFKNTSIYIQLALRPSGDSVMSWLREKDPIYAKKVEDELSTLKK